MNRVGSSQAPSRMPPVRVGTAEDIADAG
eukprot:SAG22_NODE_17538_length_303_cov_0.750000_2_plen_28_part_01